MSRNSLPLLILDLDETLVHSIRKDDPMLDMVPFNWIGHPDVMETEHHWVKKRPWLDEFLDFAKGAYRIAVWTVATEDYAMSILDRIMDSVTLEFVKTRKDCMFRGSGYVKPVSSLEGYDFDDIYIVDDKPDVIDGVHPININMANLIVIKPFFGSDKDQELKETARELWSRYR